MRIYFAAAEGSNAAAKKVLEEKVFSENSTRRRVFKDVARSIHQVREDEVAFLGICGSPAGKDAVKISDDDLRTFSRRVLRGIVAAACPKIYRFDRGAHVQCLAASGRPLEKELQLRFLAMELKTRSPSTVIGDGVFEYSIFSDGGNAYAYFRFFGAIDFVGGFFNGKAQKFT